MTPRSFCLLLPIFLFISCNQRKDHIPEPDYNPHILQPGKFIPVTGKVVNMDSVAPPPYLPVESRRAKFERTAASPRPLLPAPAREALFVPARKKVVPMDSVPKPEYLTAKIRQTSNRWPRRKDIRLRYSEESMYPSFFIGGEQGLSYTFVLCLIYAIGGILLDPKIQ